MITAESILTTFAHDWTARGTSPGGATSVLDCLLCRDSDLLDPSQRFGYPHVVLHSLIAPIEEVIDVAVDRFVNGADVDPTVRESRLDGVDGFRRGLRGRAREVVSDALGATDPELALG